MRSLKPAGRAMEPAKRASSWEVLKASWEGLGASLEAGGLAETEKNSCKSITWSAVPYAPFTLVIQTTTTIEVTVVHL